MAVQTLGTAGTCGQTHLILARRDTQVSVFETQLNTIPFTSVHALTGNSLEYELLSPNAPVSALQHMAMDDLATSTNHGKSRVAPLQ